MQISRRQFLAWCGASTAALSLGCPRGANASLLGTLATAAPAKVIWLQGSGCTGCSVSFLNRISSDAPQTAADVLLDVIELGYHPNLMAAAGETAALAAEAIYNSSPYLFVVEGGVPTSFGGAACWAWTLGGRDVTFQEAVERYAERASAIVCIGNCAAWGGIAAAWPNPTNVKGVRAFTGKQTINIAGCPPHPDWIVWTIAQFLAGAPIALDSSGRPKALFGVTVHDRCPRKDREEADTYGVDRLCLKELGCRGPETKANCPVIAWNGGVNWCVEAGAPCIGCTEPNFPVRGLMKPGEFDE